MTTEFLVVVRPFAGRNRGDAIYDADEIAEVRAGEHADHTVRALFPEPPAAPDLEPAPEA